MMQEEARRVAKKALELKQADLDRLHDLRHQLLRKPRSEQVWVSAVSPFPR